MLSKSLARGILKQNQQGFRAFSIAGKTGFREEADTFGPL
jgi:hypothetical protein